MPRHLRQKRLAVRTHGRSEPACSLDRINGEHSPLDTLTHERRSQFADKTYSHIINLPPSSTCAVDTPLIPHLPLSSCYLRWRCGMGVGGRSCCVFCECGFECVFELFVGVWVLDWLLLSGLPGEREEPGRVDFGHYISGFDQVGSVLADWRHRPLPSPWRPRWMHLRFRTFREPRTHVGPLLGCVGWAGAS
jgi:hypothetical protein